MNFIDSEFIEHATKIREDAELKVIQYDEQLSYIVSTPIFENFESFIELSKTYPTFEPKGFHNCNTFLKQYFYPQHLDNILFFIRNQLIEIFKGYNYEFYVGNNFSNIYCNSTNFLCPLKSCFPHTDSKNNNKIAINFWISSNEQDATSLWKINDNYFYDENDDWYLNNVLNKYSEENNLSVDCVNFFNFENYLEVKKVLDIPAKPNTISMYFSNTWHSPKIDTNGENLRWSYAIFYDIIYKKLNKKL